MEMYKDGSIGGGMFGMQLHMNRQASRYKSTQEVLGGGMYILSYGGAQIEVSIMSSKDKGI